MTTSASLKSAVVERVEEAEKTAASSLATVAVGARARVTKLAVDADQAGWLAAVGIGAGDGLVVLRRGAFGGPIHVRTTSGGEFAIDRSLARAIHVVAETGP